MKSYPKLFYYDSDLIGKDIHAFDKIDGQSMRFEANFKKGFYKFGSRTQMVDLKDESFGKAVNIFMEKYSEKLMNIFSKKFRGDKFAKFTVFAEYAGPNSFAGRHVIGEKMDVTLFDVWIYKRGFVPPQLFIDEFGHLGIPKLVYEGKLTQEFISDIQKNKFKLSEGVIAKGSGEEFMCKIKTKDWLNKAKTQFGEKFILEDIDNDKRLLIV